MKHLTKKVLALVLIVAVLMPATAPAIASTIIPEESNILKETLTYVDIEGNTCYISIVIDQTLNKVITTYNSEECVVDLNNNTIMTTYANGTSATEALNLPQHIDSALTSRAVGSRSYMGEIQFNPAFDQALGGTVNCALHFYAIDCGYTDDYYEINGKAYDSLSAIIAVTAAYFLGLGMVKCAAALAETLFGAFISEGIILVVGNVIKSTFVETVRALNYLYDVDVINTSASRMLTYRGSKHVVTSAGIHFNETYHEGVYPQLIVNQDNAIAVDLFGTFFLYSYPGVKRWIPS